MIGLGTEPARAQPYERFLFPLAIVEHPGAYGTAWTTEAVVRNEGTTPVVIFHSECAYRCSAPCVILMCFAGSPTPPGAPFSEGVDRGEIGSVGIPATLLSVERSKADQVSTSLRLIEVSKRTVEYGVEIPVVRERNLYTGTLSLPSVPVPPPHEGRTHLRIYGVESPADPVTLRVRAFAGDTVVWDETVWLLVPLDFHETPRPGEYNEGQPSYRLLPVPSAISEHSTVRVQIDPLTPGLKFWAMASVTSNETQHVTIVSPP
jgi:hypothetical protein